MSSSSSPCAACKLQRRKCAQGCVFAPYFPPDQPQKFANMHRVFGASNVAKLLNELPPSQREDAVNSLAYEAEARLRDPVYGCVGYISILQHRLKQVQHDLFAAKRELSAYLGPAALGPFVPQLGQPYPAHHAIGLAGHDNQYQFQGPSSSSCAPAFGMPGMGMGIGLGLATGAGPSVHPQHAQILTHEQQQQQQQLQQLMEAQQMAAAAAALREQELLRSYEQQQQQQQEELARFGAGYADGRGFDFMGGGAIVAVPPGEPSGLEPVPPQPIEVPFLFQQHTQQPQQYAQQQLWPQQQQQQQQEEQARYYQHHRTGSDEGSSGMGPSS